MPSPSGAAAATATAYNGVSLFTAMFVLMFMTGNCDACSGSNRDYLGDAVDAMGSD